MQGNKSMLLRQMGMTATNCKKKFKLDGKVVKDKLIVTKR